MLIWRWPAGLCGVPPCTPPPDESLASGSGPTRVEIDSSPCTPPPDKSIAASAGSIRVEGVM
eukprot:3913380-Karenia_brevis.AAC.1